MYFRGLRTTILSPSATSPKSLAALTRERAFSVSSRRSKSSISVIHDSPTSDSRMVEARLGEIVTSDSKLESGFSMRWQILYAFSAKAGLQNDDLTRRLFSLLSISLLRSCSSDIWPETAERSFWKVERKDSKESSKLTLVC